MITKKGEINKKIIIITIIIIMVLLLSFISIYIFKKMSYNDNTNSMDTSYLPNNKIKEQCLNKTFEYIPDGFIKCSNPNECGFYNKTVFDECVKNEVENEFINNTAFMVCFSLAKRNKSYIKEDMNTEKSEYELYLALYENNLNRCNNVSDDVHKAECFSSIGKDTSLCNNIEAEYRSICQSLSDGKSCEEITKENSTLNRCKMIQTEYNALQTKDLSQCDFIDNNYDKYRCRALIKSDERECYNIDIIIDGKIVRTSIKERCINQSYMNYGVVKPNLSNHDVMKLEDI